MPSGWRGLHSSWLAAHLQLQQHLPQELLVPQPPLDGTAPSTPHPRPLTRRLPAAVVGSSISLAPLASPMPPGPSWLPSASTLPLCMSFCRQQQGM
jgi:hypothetical protein